MKLPPIVTQNLCNGCEEMAIEIILLLETIDEFRRDKRDLEDRIQDLESK